MRARRATAADWPEVAALRTRVFVEEQGVPAEVEQDEHDATAVHALAEDDQRRGRQPAAHRGDHGEQEAAVQPLLADAGGHPDQGEQPPLRRRPRQQRQGGVHGRLGVPPLPRPAQLGRRLRQRTRAQRPRGDDDEAQDGDGGRDGQRAGPRLRPAQAHGAGVHPGCRQPDHQGDHRQAPLQHQQPGVEGPPRAVVGAQPALEAAVQHVPDDRLADHQVPGDDDRGQRGQTPLGERAGQPDSGHGRARGLARTGVRTRRAGCRARRPGRAGRGW